MNHKVILSLLAASVLICFHPVEAQQPAKVPRIGYLSGTADSKAPEPQDEGFRQGLRDFGSIEGENIVVEHRYAEGKTDRSPGLVAELVRLKVYLSFQVQHRSAQPSRRPRRFPLSS